MPRIRRRASTPAHLQNIHATASEPLPVVYSASPTILVKACGHTGCQLSSSDGCCACLDRRPIDPSGYYYYVDGQGWQSRASRSTHYCPHCQQNPPSSAPPFSTTSQTEDNPTPPTPILPTSQPTTTLQYQDSQSSSSSSSVSQPKACGHSGCLLPTSIGCCSMSHICRLQEVLLTLFVGVVCLYVRQQGWLFGILRTANYCFSCRAAPGLLSDLLPSMSNPSREVSDSLASIITPPFCHTQNEADSGVRKNQVEDDLCNICFIAQPDALLLPCAHLVSCTSCAVLVLTHNAATTKPHSDEISGRELVSQTERSFQSGRNGQLIYTALRNITPTRPVTAGCPICRQPVKRWIKVFRS